VICDPSQIILLPQPIGTVERLDIRRLFWIFRIVLFVIVAYDHCGLLIRRHVACCFGWRQSAVQSTQICKLVYPRGRRVILSRAKSAITGCEASLHGFRQGPTIERIPLRDQRNVLLAGQEFGMFGRTRFVIRGVIPLLLPRLDASKLQLMDDSAGKYFVGRNCPVQAIFP
jgi:hypothetical protein